MEKILISACLMGWKVRYDASDAGYDDPLLDRWLGEGRLVTFCPEIAGGFPVPRPPAEIEDSRGGEAVLAGESHILENTGRDVTRYFRRGADLALETARTHGIRLAILKEGSPSCGSGHIYDGSFTGRTVPGQGITTALLERNGVRVFGEKETSAAAEYLAYLEEEKAG